MKSKIPPFISRISFLLALAGAFIGVLIGLSNGDEIGWALLRGACLFLAFGIMTRWWLGAPYDVGRVSGALGNAAAVLLVEVDGLVDDLELQAERVLEACRVANVRELRLAKNDAERAKLWKGRKQAFGAFGRLAPNAYVLDGVIPRTKLPEVLRAIASVSARHGLVIANVFHAGDGNLHPTILYDERQPGVVDRVRAASDEILTLVIAVGGALSGEHGIGLEKIGHMGSLFGEIDLEQMRRLRSVFDPRGLCNPGKVIPAPGQCVEPGRSHRKLPLGH